MSKLILYGKEKINMLKVELVLPAVALAMGVVSVVLAILGTVPIETTIILLGIGLFAISVAKLQKVKD
ncbi:hypothetical protein ACFLW6_05185 [Chloroflexota bacterium]